MYKVLLKIHSIILVQLLFVLALSAQNFITPEEKQSYSLYRINQEANPIDLEEDRFVTSEVIQGIDIENLRLARFEEKEIEAGNMDITKIPATYEPIAKVALSRKEHVAYISTNSYRHYNGKVFQLIEAKFDYNVIGQNSDLNKTTGAKNYVAHSALSSGNIYKFGVDQDGLYKIDAQRLSDLGIQNPSVSQLQLFGNGGGPMHWNTSIDTIDDVREIPIKIYDNNSDGILNNSDYILFFATGPHESYWDFNNACFRHRFNDYEDYSYYFLKTTGSNPKGIATAPTMTANQTTDYFYSHLFREKDSIILEKVGGYWLGDAMKYSAPNHVFSFNTDNAAGSRMSKLYMRLAYYSLINNGIINVKLNGNVVDQTTYAKVNAGAFAYNHVVASTSSFTHSYPSSNVNQIETQAILSSPSDMGYLDFLDLSIARNLSTGLSTPTIIRNPDVLSAGSNIEYQFNGILSNKEIWDISNIHDVQILSIQNSAGKSSFVAKADANSRFLLFDPSSDGLSPKFIEEVQNQDLHADNSTDLIVLTDESLRPAAEKLVTYRQDRGENCRIVLTKEVYNEFGSGSKDPVAIRNYMKMLYDKASTPADAPKNLLLFGDASYDNKGRIEENNTNIIPTIQIKNLKRIDAFNTDDLYAFLDDGENPLNYSLPQSMDIGVGRVPCSDLSVANMVVDKIINYESSNSFGSWKLLTTFFADNQDNGNPSHFFDSENISDSLSAYNGVPNIDKIYGDAYELTTSAGGVRIPQMNQSINSRVNQGTLILNYNGHGGETGLGQEGFLTLNDIYKWTNPNNLPIFITATCDFSKFDFPRSFTAGEQVLVRSSNGGIALITTTADVFQGPNRRMNRTYIKHQFQPINGLIPSIGEAWRVSKNQYLNGSSVSSNTTYNYQKFALLGDPSMRPALPQNQIIIDSIIHTPSGAPVDTLRALGRYKIYGHMEDPHGQFLNEFDGEVLPTIYDKPLSFKTVVQTPGSTSRNYTMRQSIVYKAKAQVKSGVFQTEFILPKDIQYQFGPAKVSSYAFNQNLDAAGADFTYILGGEDTTFGEDNTPPKMQAYLNDENFVNGGITHPNPKILLHLEDESGINTSGSSIGHDMVAVLDGDQNKSYVLNNYYESDANDYRKGTVLYPLYDLEPGQHYLDITVWDGSNNSQKARLDFVVVSQDEMKLEHVYNYPNPFSTQTNFMFEHNFPDDLLKIRLQIYTMGGKIVKTIKQERQSIGTRIADIFWDGTDKFGDKIANGAYFYILDVESSTGKKSQKIEKLFIIN